MTDPDLAAALDADRDRIVGFLQDFIRIPSPNPPGDTRDAATHLRGFLEAEGIDVRTIDPHPQMPNLVASFEGGAGPGRHLVLNGHIDVFPVGDGRGWTRDPWGGALDDGKVWGRGACDMKAGTTCSVFTFLHLWRRRAELKGRLTLTCVSDEETFGPWGARYLMEHHPEVHGDCCLNGEPGSPYTVRFGEKAPVWFRFEVAAQGAHGAYHHVSDGAIRRAMRLADDLRKLEDIEARPSDNVATALAAAREAMDVAMGPGAADIVPKVTVNVGRIEGGLKVNMIPDSCLLEVDVRLPIGVEPDTVRARVAEIAGAHEGVAWEEINATPPNWCDPYGEMAEILQDTVEGLRGYRPTPIVSLGATDCRLWRDRGIPAYVYGPFPHGMGGADEHVDVEDLIHIAKTHALAAWRYLQAG